MAAMPLVLVHVHKLGQGGWRYLRRHARDAVLATHTDTSWYPSLAAGWPSRLPQARQQPRVASGHVPKSKETYLDS